MLLKVADMFLLAKQHYFKCLTRILLNLSLRKKLHIIVAIRCCRIKENGKNGTRRTCKNHAQIPGMARIIDIGLNLHLLPIFACATGEASD